MGNFREVDPATIRFTQDSIKSCFQAPYDHFSIREAVRRISNGRMEVDDFPTIKVNIYKGDIWSIDNRRLWVFRYSKCNSIRVQVVDKMHPRLSSVLADPHTYATFKAERYFPRVRGPPDYLFDIAFPMPEAKSFLQRNNVAQAAIGKDANTMEMHFSAPRLPDIKQVQDVEIQQQEARNVIGQVQIKQQEGRSVTEEVQIQEQESKASHMCNKLNACVATLMKICVATAIILYMFRQIFWTFGIQAREALVMTREIWFAISFNPQHLKMTFVAIWEKTTSFWALVIKIATASVCYMLNVVFAAMLKKVESRKVNCKREQMDQQESKDFYLYV